MLVFLAILIAVAFFIEVKSINEALKGIDYTYTCSQPLVEPDETLEVITTISNKSSRFVPFIRLDELLPEEANVLSKSARIRRDEKGAQRHLSSVYMMPRSKLERRLTISFSRRGRYLFRGARVTGGDFMGLSDEMKQFFVLQEVVVYPKAAKVDDLLSILGGFFGDMSVRRFIMEDPVLTIGAREYTGREPLKQISWTHSARANRLMVKQFDYTIDPFVTVMLDVNTKSAGEVREQVLERCFSITRSVCQLLEDKGIPYDFITNATTGNTISSWSYKGEGLGRWHFFSILEGLGRATYDSTESFQSTIEKMKKHQTGNRSTIIILPERNAEKEKMVQRLQESGKGSAKLIYGEDIDDIYSRD